MATIECRSPVTSTGNHVTGKYRYCTSADFSEHDCIPDGDIHGGNASCCGYSWENYRDISKTGGSTITYYASSNVVSLRVFRVDDVVCPDTGDISNGVRVTMWDDEDATGQFLWSGVVRPRRQPAGQRPVQRPERVCRHSCQRLGLRLLQRAPCAHGRGHVRDDRLRPLLRGPGRRGRRRCLPVVHVGRWCVARDPSE